jgi:diguanylate cyclase (GGDEF)-like protein
LGVAFAAVAVLATAANVIAEHGTQIIRRKAAAAAIVRPIALPIRSHGLEPTLQAAQALVVKEVHDNLLLEALAHYGQAVERRKKIDTAETSELLSLADVRLKSQAEGFLEEVDYPGVTVQSRAVRAGIVSVRKAGATVIRNSDERRAVLAAYWSHLDSADAQVKQTLDKNNWRIFGRVISRQSLLSLSRALDDIRRQSTQLNISAEDPAVLDTLTHSHALFAATLAHSAPGLSRSQGQQWVADLGREFDGVSESRSQLAALEGENARRLETFESSSEKLAELVRAVAEELRRQQRSVHDHADSAGMDRVAGRASGASPPGTPASDEALIAAPGTGIAPDHAELRSDGVAPPWWGSGGVPIAAISGAVMLIVLVISVATVRSIVMPIRQFMLTTERLAAGEETARFMRGGIKELDALAVSFNRMAESLAEARGVTRQYQGQLESRVDERTRQLQHLAEHDPLTELPNRRQLVAYLDAALQRAAREGLRVAVFFLDLDNFKNINDSMGHAFGDLVLQGVAQRLREASGTSGYAARLGGDEFTVIYENAGSRSEVSAAGNALVQAFQRPLWIEGRELIISISAGASIYPDHERDSDALLRAADAALFRAKNSGRACVSLFSPDLLEAAALKFSLEQGLRRALEHGELELWFQPEVSFASLRTTLVEALLRWRLPDGEYVAPADFLSVAEDSGLSNSINDWVLRNAIRYAAEWHHGLWPEARVAINVSARQLLDTSFVARVRELLHEYRLPPGNIEIELTETVLQTERATVDVLRELRRFGINVALDDFGTGYSSLASLEKLPLTRVKLDRSLIDTIDSSPRSLAIARAIIGLCESLGLEVTAEGVERREQLALLIGSPAMVLQGYLFARPVSGEALPETLTAVAAHLESLLVAGLPGIATAAAAASYPVIHAVRS